MNKSVEKIFQAASELNASDIHLTAGQPPIVRVDGRLAILRDFEALSEVDTQSLATEILVKPQQERFYQEKELDTSYQAPDGTRFRLNFHWTLGTIAIAARVLRKAIPAMEDIDMPQIAYDLLNQQAGLILTVGPTGSGKTTSMAAMIEHINNNQGKHIVTLEDPVEYLFESKKSIIKQREYGSDFLSFPEGLKHVLRQDPDVIMVGEMRDLDTISLAITAAETGHLVFGTLHTYSGPQTVHRIVDSFPPYQQNQIRLQLSLTLKGVLSQRLVPKIGGGRVAAREVLINTNATANLIRENKIAQLYTVIETGSKNGMMTLDRALRVLVQDGMVAEEDAEMFTRDTMALV